MSDNKHKIVMANLKAECNGHIASEKTTLEYISTMQVKIKNYENSVRDALTRLKHARDCITNITEAIEALESNSLESERRRKAECEVADLKAYIDDLPEGDGHHGTTV